MSQGQANAVGQKYALIIGNNEYDDSSLARLLTPAADVVGLATVLKATDIGGFDEVISLVNEPSIRVRREMARFFRDKHRDDLLLLYFSGHGVLDDYGKLYLAVKDTERDLLKGTAIEASFITDVMDGSYSRQQVLILDCCHSGAFARGAKGVTGASVGTAQTFEGTGSGRVVLTATDATQYAWEGDQIIGRADNSVFTRFLIEGLQTGEADANVDGRITLDELYDYAHTQVVRVTPKQNPRKWSFNQEGEIVVARNPHPPVPQPVELPMELRQAIESPLANVREGAVRELDRLLRGSNTGLSLAAHDALKHLGDDDSRRVSNAASESLKAYEARSRAEADRREQEYLAHLAAQAEQDRIMKARLEANRLAAERAEQERLAQQRVEAERIAKEKLEAERLIAQEMEEEKQARLAALYDAGIQAARREAWQSAIDAFRQVLAIDGQYRDGVNLLSQAEAGQQKVDQTQARAARLDRLYRQVLKWKEDQDWPKMIAACDEILALDATYRDVAVLRTGAQTARQRLEAERIAREKAAEEQRARLATLYDAGLQATKREEWPSAINAFRQVLSIASTYRDTASRLAKAEAEQRKVEQAQARAARLDRLYQQALKWHAAKDWPKLIATCNEILVLDANYLDVAILRTDAQITQQRFEAERLATKKAEAERNTREKSAAEQGAAPQVTKKESLQPDHAFRSKWLFWIQWSLATVIGSVIGGVIQGSVLEHIFPYYSHDLLSATIFGAAIGISVGTTQWFVVRRWHVIAEPAQWIIVTATGWAIGAGIMLVFEDPLFLVGLLHGVSVGYMQWLVLRRGLRRAGLWIVAWAAPMALLNVTLSSFVTYYGFLSLAAFVQWCIDGIIVGTVTGAVLTWLLRINHRL